MKIYTLTLGCCATNTYIIIDNGAAAVIDPADSPDRIFDFLAKNNAALDSVLVTHGHFDHIGAVSALQKHGAKVFMSKTDYDLIDFDEPDSLFGTGNGSFSLDTAVCDRIEYNVIGHTFKAISTPGHTPGGLCYVLENEVIFSGDTLFRAGIGRTDFMLGAFTELITSVKKLYALPGDLTVLPGHGAPTTLDFERENNPYVR